MRRVAAGGFTLIELMIVIGIIALLVSVLAPAILLPRDMANALADQCNLRRHYGWMQAHERKLHRLPMAGGHRFVLSTWTAGICAHTEENFDCFWTPGPARGSDPQYHELRLAVARGQNPWPELSSTSSLDTHYAGRALEHAGTRQHGADEAWMANDNEFGWSLRDGTINVLFHSGVVRSYSYQTLQEIYALPAFDPAVPIPTFGPASPIGPCRKLAR